MFWFLKRPFLLYFWDRAPPEPILTFNTSNGVVPRKDVPFGGTVNVPPHFGSQTSKKPPQKKA